MAKKFNVIELPKHGDSWREHSAHSAALNYAQSVVEANAGAGVIDIGKYYDELATSKERNQFLDTLANRLSMSEVGWAQLYTALSLIKEHPEYMNRKGFRTFEEFLKARIGGALTTWRRLEGLYHYAKIACPELFDIRDANDAALQAEMHEALRSTADKVKVAKTDREINEAASFRRMGNELQGAVSLVKSGHGEHSLVRVIRKAAKEKPELVAELQRQLIAGEVKQGPSDKGKFISVDQFGRKRWLISAIEREIGKKTHPERKAEIITLAPSLASAKRMVDKMQLVEDRKDRDELFKHLINQHTWIGKRIKRYAER